MNYAADFLRYVRDHNAAQGVCLAFLVTASNCVTFYPARRMEIGG